jgi:urease accessory protein
MTAVGIARGKPASQNDCRPALGAFLGSLQLADSFFPSGLFTLSHGLESYAQAKLLDAVSLETITADLLRHSVGPSDAVALAIAHRAAIAADFGRIAEADLRLTAVKVAREPRQASIRLGRQLLSLGRDVFDNQVAGAYLAQVRDQELPGNQAIALGIVMAALGIPVREAVAGELYSFAASCAGSALRMSLIDHRQAQRVVHRLHPVIADVTDDALARTISEIGGSAPFAEIMSMQHESAELRLFVT